MVNEEYEYKEHREYSVTGVFFHETLKIALRDRSRKKFDPKAGVIIAVVLLN